MNRSEQVERDCLANTERVMREIHARMKASGQVKDWNPETSNYTIKKVPGDYLWCVFDKTRPRRGHLCVFNTREKCIEKIEFEYEYADEYRRQNKYQIEELAQFPYWAVYEIDNEERGYLGAYETFEAAERAIENGEFD